MPTTVPVPFARLARRGLCVAVALALSLMCVVFAAAASAPPMTGMIDMAAASAGAAQSPPPASAVGASTRGLPSGVVGDVVRHATAPIASVMSPRVRSMCLRGCLTDAIEMCLAVGGLTLAALVALLVASRSVTFMALLSRAHPRAFSRRWRRQAPRTVPSSITLCVFRV